MTVCNKFGHIATPGATSDAVLWLKMKQGNEQALGQLYQLYFKALHKHGSLLCKDRELVSDCVHELFSRLWTRRDSISEASNVRMYLYRSLDRIIVSQLLRSKRQFSYDGEEIASPDSFEQLLINGELRKQQLTEIKKCLWSLPKCQREVILLKFFNDLTYTEISEIMDVQVASVYNLISRAIEQLRQKMQFKAFAA
jgi:RNA polymerase sigma factor (sigma-70 family)